MPARFESVNSPVVREPVVTNGGAYTIDDEIVITGFSGIHILNGKLSMIDN